MNTMLVVAGMANAFLAGALVALPPALAPVIGADRARTLRTVTLALLVPLMLLAGFLIDKWGVPTTLMLGALLAAVTPVALERETSRTATWSAAAVLAGAIAAIATADLIVLCEALFAENPIRSVNLGFVVATAGAVVAAPVLRLVHRQLGATKTLFALSITMLLPAACLALTPPESLPHFDTAASWGAILKQPRLGLLLFAIALCAPLEITLGPWVRRFATEHAYVPGAITLQVTGFWLAFLGSRLAACLWMPVGHEIWILLVLVVVLGITAGNLLGAYAPQQATLVVCFMGACAGPLLPTFVGLAVGMFANDAAAAAALANTTAVISLVAVAPWIDATLPGRSTRATLRGVTAIAVLLLAPSLLLALWTR